MALSYMKANLDDAREAMGILDGATHFLANGRTVSVPTEGEMADLIKLLHEEVPLKTYTVFGIYKDNGQRCGFSVQAADPASAELAAQLEACELNGWDLRENPEPVTVAAVLEGEAEAVG